MSKTSLFKAPIFHAFRIIRFALLSVAATLIAVVVSVLAFRIAEAAISLVYFQATPQPTSVVLEWETATELDNAGYFVNRSFTQNTGYSRIGGFISAKGDPFLGATYRYTDTIVTSGTTYWYKLESINIRQGSNFFEPPVSAMPGGVYQIPPTRTATATLQPGNANPTSTPTPTSTLQPGALTRTPTFAIINPYPGSDSTPVVTQLLSGSQPTSETFLPLNVTTNTLPSPSSTISGTATLIPFPTITLEFPYPSSNIVPTPPKAPNLSENATWFTPLRLLLIGFVLFVWVFLGGWFYFSLRKLG